MVSNFRDQKGGRSNLKEQSQQARQKAMPCKTLATQTSSDRARTTLLSQGQQWDRKLIWATVMGRKEDEALFFF